MKLRCKDDLAGCSDMSKTPTSSIFKMKKKDTTPPPPLETPKGSNSNVRDINNDPGDVMPTKMTSKETNTTRQVEQAQLSETTFSKAKKKLKTPQELKSKKK